MNDAVRLVREKRRQAREERSWQREQMLYERLLTPAVTRTLLVAGIIAYSTAIARSGKNEGPVQSALAFALPGIGIPLIAAEAGITDKWALAAISATGVGYTTGQMLAGWQDAYGAGRGLSLGDLLGPVAMAVPSIGIPLMALSQGMKGE
jgi:hypothetical protein